MKLRSVVQGGLLRSQQRKNVQTIRELIADKGSVSKVRQVATTIEKVKARDLTKRLDDLDPQSSESHGS